MNETLPARLVTLYLVQDRRLVAARLLRLFGRLPNLACIGAGPFSHRTLSTIEAVRPDVVVFDIGCGRPRALLRLHLVRKAAGPGLLLVLADAASATLHRRCLACGANGCFDPASEFDALAARLHALASAAHGDSPWRGNDPARDLSGVVH